MAENIRIAVLISGGGSNLKALHTAIEAGILTNTEIALVVSNKPTAAGLQWATAQGIPTCVITNQSCKALGLEYEEALLAQLQQHQVEVVVLAGFLRIFTGKLLSAYAGRMVNIHPSLLPAYGGKGMYGMAVHQAVLDNQELFTGCTVHLVTAAVDEGDVLGQATVPVYPTDTVAVLAQRVLEQEHQLYAQVLQQWLPTVVAGTL